MAGIILTRYKRTNREILMIKITIRQIMKLVFFCFVLFCKSSFVPRTQRNLHYKKNKWTHSALSLNHLCKSTIFFHMVDFTRYREARRNTVQILCCCTEWGFSGVCTTTFYFSSQHFNTTNFTLNSLHFPNRLVALVLMHPRENYG